MCSLFKGGFYLKCSSGDTVQGVAKARMFPKSFLPCNNIEWYERVTYLPKLFHHFVKCISLLWILPLLRNMAWISSILLFLWKGNEYWQAEISKQILCKSFEVDADLVSGTNIAVKSAPMMQSAAYNQNVPENFSGDSTCVGDYKGY